MTASAIIDQFNGTLTACLPAVRFIPAEYRGQLFTRERLLPANPVEFYNNNARPIWDAKAVHLRQLLWALSYSFWIRQVADEQILCQDVLDIIVDKICAFRF